MRVTFGGGGGGGPNPLIPEVPAVSLPCNTRACRMLSNGKSLGTLSVPAGEGSKGTLPSIGHTVFGDLKTGGVVAALLNCVGGV